MKKITKFICFILAVLLLISAVACEKAPTDSTEPKPTDVTPSEAVADIYNLYGTVDNADEQTSDFINAIKPEINGYRVEYWTSRESCDKLVSIGIEGIPILMRELYAQEEDIVKNGYNRINSSRALFYEECLYALLRVDRNAVRSWSNNEEGVVRKNLVTFYNNAISQIPIVLQEKSAFNENIIKLREFGILSIPFITNEIKKGNTEYEAYFTAIGLHMDVPEFMVYMTDYNLSWEERYEKDGFMDGAEDFDYKIWLEENEEDLDNLFKFLEAYCAEYEAENK